MKRDSFPGSHGALRNPLPVIALGALLSAGVWSANAAPILTAIATAGGYTLNPSENDYLFALEINNRSVDVVPAPGVIDVGFDVQQTVATYPISGENIVVFARTGAKAGPGTMRIYVNSEGHSDDTHRYYYAMGRADASAKFTDTFVIQPSATHPAGTFLPLSAKLAVDRLIGAGPGAEVSLLATLTFEGPDVSDPFNPRGNPLGVNGQLYSNIHYLNEVKDNDQAFAQTDAQFLVGSTYRISGSVTAYVVTQTGNTWYGNLRDSWGGVDAFHTAHCYVWSEDPTVTITTESGVSYALPAPEGPQLTVQRNGQNLMVSWPAAAADFKLFVTRSLSLAQWTEVATTPVVADDRLTVTLTIDGTGQFFRLQK